MTYIYGDTAAVPERDRLRLLERCFDPTTARRLDSLGVGPGWRCADIGAGSGSVVRLLAERVGADGAVLAVDVDPRFLDAVPPNVAVRQLDVTTEEIEPGGFDLVHCRFLLMHLREPAAALARMVAALRPGGVVLVEEADWGLRTFAGHPDAAWATDYLHEIDRRFLAEGVTDHYFGRRLPGLCAALPLVDVEIDAATFTSSAGDDVTTLHRLTTEAARPAMLAVGGTADEFDRLMGVFDGDTLRTVSLTSVAAIGRSPG